MKYEAVIFDCFGVLASEAWQMFFDKHFAHNSNLSKVAAAYNIDADRGVHSFDERIVYLAELAGISREQVKTELLDRTHNAQLLDYISENLTGRFTTAILSNVGKGIYTEKFSEWGRTVFDHVILSCDIGLIKPDPEIFQYTLRTLGVEARRCLFIDDRLQNVVSAQRAGMTALQYTDTHSIIPAIESELYGS